MHEGFDVVAGVERGLRGRAEAWRFIREFTEHWGVPAVEDWDGHAVKALERAEQRLGFRLPEAVREWVWVRARNEEALEAVRRALPVDWVM